MFFFSEFESLPAHIQDEIIDRNSKMGLAVIVARSENFTSGYEQVEDYTG